MDDPYDHPTAGWWPGMMPFAPFAGMAGMYGPGMYRRPQDWRDRYRARGADRDFWDRASDELASWFGDEEAGERREADHRGRGPRGYRRSDDRILEDVNDSLTEDPVVDASGLTVTVLDGDVVLDGEVGTRREKRRAEDCAEAVRGVSHVQNNLRVRRMQRAGPASDSG